MAIAERLARIGPSATMAAGERAERLRAQGVDVIDLGPGQPDFPTPAHIAVAGSQAIAEGQTKYTPAAGIRELREAVARRFTERYGVEYEASETIITCGGKHALYSAFSALLDAGDEVIVPTPYWVSYPDQIRILGGKPVFVDAAETDGFVVRPEAVVGACTDRSRAIVLNSPCNPTGAVLPAKVVEDLTAFAIDRELVVVYDECYEGFLYEDARHASPLEFGNKAKPSTVICGSCSKTYAMTGWRIGYAVGPRSMIAAMSRLQSHLTSNPCSVSQWAALAAITGDQAAVGEMLSAFAERRELVLGRFERMPGVGCTRPLGAFYVFPNVTELLSEKIPTADDLATHLIDEAHVVTVPGSAFGRDGYLRLSFAVALDRLQEALDRLEETFAKLLH
ncbi:MAG: pyridoxal phosphate-dependent aminotransferase [Acidobacteriota bacterium]